MSASSRHIDAFNARSLGRLGRVRQRFTPDAVMTFEGGRRPFVAARHRRAYAAQPPTDTMASSRSSDRPRRVAVRFRWAAGGTGR